MNNSAKIDLENGIFFRAARLNARIHARWGKLFCEASDARLQAMLCVYNAFFSEENWRLCAEETAVWRRWWRAYQEMASACGENCPRIIYRPDLQIELVWNNSVFLKN